MTVWSFNSGGLRKRRFTEATHSGGRGGWRAGWPDRPAPVDDPDCCLNRVPTRRSRRVTVRPPTSSTPGSARRPLIPGPSSRGLPPRWAARSIGTAPPSRPRRIGRPWGPSLSAAACSTAAVKVRRTACAYPMEGVADTHTAGGPLSPSIPLSLSCSLPLPLPLSLSPSFSPSPSPSPSLSLSRSLSLPLPLPLPPPSLPPSLSLGGDGAAVARGLRRRLLPTTRPSVDTLAGTRRRRSSTVSLSGRGRRATCGLRAVPRGLPAHQGRSGGPARPVAPPPAPL